MARIAFVSTLLIASVLSTMAHAQTTSTREGSGAVGVVAGLGPQGGGHGMLRLSADSRKRLALDVDLGAASNGTSSPFFFVGQLRVFSRATASSPVFRDYFIVGMTWLRVQARTEVRWPNGTRTYFVQDLPGSTGLLGYGAEWKRKSRVRVGCEVGVGAAGEGAFRAMLRFYATVESK